MHKDKEKNLIEKNLSFFWENKGEYAKRLFTHPGFYALLSYGSLLAIANFALQPLSLLATSAMLTLSAIEIICIVSVIIAFRDLMHSLIISDPLQPQKSTSTKDEEPLVVQTDRRQRKNNLRAFDYLIKLLWPIMWLFFLGEAVYLLIESIYNLMHIIGGTAIPSWFNQAPLWLGPIHLTCKVIACALLIFVICYLVFHSKDDLTSEPKPGNDGDKPRNDGDKPLSQSALNGRKTPNQISGRRPDDSDSNEEDEEDLLGGRPAQ